MIVKKVGSIIVSPSKYGGPQFSISSKDYGNYLKIRNVDEILKEMRLMK